MYYILYLTSLCRRRNWPEPIYNAYTSSSGYTCTVRVNNREYRTDSTCSNETLARESAAMCAYLICRNFSVNDGMYPAGHDHGGAVQGMRVAIGAGRKPAREDDVLSLGSVSGSGSDSSRGGSWSGGSSPVRVGIEGDGRGGFGGRV
ncbi:hypothetical protein N7471_009715 [Penicillium samsonianum]|uniref:uncharacterized protein n=1 Tax=Penicillium samsonianum TaxID=1882272 RepID=UPI00254813C0|nr:uncharacterized protein N7471_009715 [Penicillium samsonianum]KAJ6128498.1 hypothetical protein N7471_009715 [Penicillium samsonianum]